jgi:hypothetical protein
MGFALAQLLAADLGSGLEPQLETGPSTYPFVAVISYR